MEYTLFIVVLAVVWLVVLLRLKKGRYSEANGEFKQADVSVNYEAGTITLGKRTFPISTVRSVRWASGIGQSNFSEAYIETSEMSYPQHKIKFINKDQAEQFCTRLQLAIEKAGGGTFT